MADEVDTVLVPGMSDDGETPIVEPQTRMEDAPWGYKDDGTPYRRDPAAYKAREARKRGSRGTPSGRAAKTKTGRTKAAAKPTYRDHVLGMIQTLSIPVAVAATKDETFAADLVVIEHSAEPVAEAVDQLAAQNEAVARALDKLAEIGPYGLLIGALTPMILQIGANHGLIRPGFLGTVEPGELVNIGRQMADDTIRQEVA